MNLNPDQIIGQLRPLLQLAALVLIVIALSKFAGFNIPLSGAWWEYGFAGFLAKNI
ncbi:MAG: hypothetical protein IPM06_18110 [Rhizobiales bacterium]|nr:hypothetical protein [Hyphomicrobiales bacterium]